VVGVHVSVPETGEVPWTVAKLASDGTPLAERVNIGIEVEESVAVTVKLRVDVWTTVSAEGAVRTGEGWVPTLIVTVVVLVSEPLVPVTSTV
jgi:hypothetical protein